MTLTISRDRLAEAVNVAAKITSAVDYHGVWQTIRLQTVRDHLCLAASDTKVWLNLTLEASGELEPIRVSGRRLADAVNSLSAELIGLQVEGGKLKIYAGKGWRSLPLLSVDEPPERDFEAETRLTIDADKLRDAIAFVSPHLGSIDDPNTMSVAAVFLFTDEGRLKMLGTDKNELAQVDLGESEEIPFVGIPERVAILASSLMTGDVEIGVSQSAAEIRWINGRLLGQLLDHPVSGEVLIRAAKHGFELRGGTGPEPFSVTVEAKDLLRGLAGVRALGDLDSASKGKRVKLTLNGSATLSTASQDGQAEEEVTMDLTNAQDMALGFSSIRAERVLRGFGDRVLTMTISDNERPIKFEAAGLPDRAALLFTMRI